MDDATTISLVQLDVDRIHQSQRSGRVASFLGVLQRAGPSVGRANLEHQWIGSGLYISLSRIFVIAEKRYEYWHARLP